MIGDSWHYSILPISAGCGADGATRRPYQKNVNAFRTHAVTVLETDVSLAASRSFARAICWETI
jgi:hypothetical protein